MPVQSRFVRYAPKGSKHLLTEMSDNLPNARRLVVTAPLTTEDGGAEGDFTLAVSAATSSARGVVKLAAQLGGSADAPDVRGIRVLDSATPVLLTAGEVQDGEVLGRVGTALVGVAALSTGGGTLSGNLAMSGNKVTGLGSGVATGDAATYGQLTSMLNGLDWQKSVASAISEQPSSAGTGERYLVVATATGTDWTGQEEKIAEWSGTAWTFVTPNKGYTVHNEDTGQDLTYNGTHPAGAWVNIGASVDHGSLLNREDEDAHPQYQLASLLEANDGYAGLDVNGYPIKPTKGVRLAAPGSPAPGELWVDASDLKFRNNAGSPATELVERQARRNQNDGYAGLDSNGRVEANQAPAKTVYVTGGAQAIAPADIGAPATTRSVATGVGLGGGGNLSADRTLSIVAFSGFLSKDVDPASQTYPPGPTVHATYDVGPDGFWVPTGVRLPATVDAGLVTEVVFEYQDASTRIVTNTNTGSTLDDTLQGLANFFMGDVTMAADSNGQAIRKIILRTRNTTGSDIVSINIGVFRVRALALPRGGGNAFA